jgi:hypothetical protein
MITIQDFRPAEPLIESSPMARINPADLEYLIPLLIEFIIPTDDLRSQKLLPALFSRTACSLIPKIYIFPAWNCMSHIIQCHKCTLLLLDHAVTHSCCGLLKQVGQKVVKHSVSVHTCFHVGPLNLG